MAEQIDWPFFDEAHRTLTRELASWASVNVADEEYPDVAALNGGLQGTLTKDGMVFNAVDAAPFRQTLRDAGFYKDWRTRYGDEAWHVLETAVGTTLT